MSLSRRRFGAAVLVAALAGCTRSLRDRAMAVAKAGAAASETVDAYYGTLEADTDDAWELYAFEQGFNFPPREGTPSPEEAARLAKRAASEAELRALYVRQRDALESRRRLATAMRGAYASFGELAAYDSPGAVDRALDEALAPAKAVLATPLPDPTGLLPSLGATPLNLMHDLVNEIETVRSNRALRRSGAHLAKISQDYAALFRAEEPVYKGIAADREGKARTVLAELLESRTLSAKDLLQRAVSGFGVTVSDAPLSDPRAVGGASRLIDARQNPLRPSTLASDAADAVASSLDALAALHAGLDKGGRLSIAEALRRSEAAKALVAQLKGTASGAGK